MLRLWCRPVATALIRPLAWETPYASGVALKGQKRKKERKKERERGRKEGRKERRKKICSSHSVSKDEACRITKFDELKDNPTIVN